MYGSIGYQRQTTGEHMKSKGRWMGVFAAILISAAGLSAVMSSRAATSKEAAEAAAMMSGYNAEQRAAAALREKDAAWKPTCTEVGSIQIGDGRNPRSEERRVGKECRSRWSPYH